MAGEDAQATEDERAAAAAALDALDEFFFTVRTDHGVPDEEPVPIHLADLNNTAQVRAFLRMVAVQGRLL